MRIKELVEKYGRAELGVDGNCGFALLGGDLQEGESDFVEITEPTECVNNQISAAKRALYKLRDRLCIPDLSYYLGKSHPMFLG